MIMSSVIYLAGFFDVGFAVQWYISRLDVHRAIVTKKELVKIVSVRILAMYWPKGIVTIVIRSIAALTLVSIFASAYFLSRISTDLASDQGKVRIRNALIFEVGDVEDANWKPEDVPDTFLLERSPVPKSFLTVVKERGSGNASSEFAQTIQIAKHLVRSSKLSGSAIQSDIAHTYTEIVENGEGYCSDYTLVLNGLAIAAGIPIREWGMSFDQFSGDGHAFSEVFDRGLDKWVFIDTFYSFFVTGREGTPLSVLELRGYYQSGHEDLLNVNIIEPAAFRFPSERYAIEYYRRGIDNVFLIWGNNVFEYEAHWAVQIAAELSRSAEQGVAILFGLQPRIVILRSESNLADIARLYATRLNIVATGILLIIVSVGSCILLLAWFRSRKRRRMEL